MSSIKNYILNQIKYGYFFKKQLNLVKSYQDLSQNELEHLENEKLITHIHNAYHKSKFYKDFYNKHGVNLNQIQNKADVLKLPIVTKSDIKNHIDDVYIGNKIKYTSYTSGTSGSPLKVYYDLGCVLNEASYNEIFRNKAGHFFGQKVVSLRGVLDKNTIKRFDTYANTLYLSSFNLNRKHIDTYIKAIKEFQPNAILAYPSSLEMLSNLLLEKNEELNIPVVFTSSETLYSYQREKIERVLNTKIYDRYGNAERTISLIQEPNSSNYIEPKLYSINEYKEDAIITTNLINKSFPLIRYFVNDSVVLDTTSNKTVIKEITGRIDDYLLTKDGTKIGRMDLVFKGVNNIRFAQIIQNTQESFIVNIVKAIDYSDKDETLIRSNIIDRIGNDTPFSFNYIEENELIKSSKNKFKLVINNLN
ncbi:phenylacetate--CoA ligase family protein [Psychroserpens ponticola]|uniref:Phenylacetate--CoA ligase family protein n=1 Tax=Psychroserpens ponticola TaxID=2932268 RepID=A0ABY7RY45_9FLAO|nr:hypothetical protein [Psychroserpens ponticola]WCO01640.1 hypothetical protein MUN68_016455 [Psychroserpens ponticola]